MDQATKDFLTYDYADAKDLAKSFLTLIAAVLVFSITFSEKIIGFQTAGRSKKVFLVLSWVLFFMAVIGCGVALVVDSIALQEAVDCGLSCRTPHYGLNSWDVFNIGTFIMTVAGVFFGLGLMSLIGSALLSISTSPARAGSAESGSSTDVLIERLVLDSGPDSDPKSEIAPGERSPPL